MKGKTSTRPLVDVHLRLVGDVRLDEQPVGGAGEEDERDPGEEADAAA